MTKLDLTKEISIRTGRTLSEVLPIIDAFLAVSTENLQSGNEIFLRGFGTFRLVTSKERPARIVKSGTPIIIPPTRRVKFKAAPLLAELVAEKTTVIE